MGRVGVSLGWSILPEGLGKGPRGSEVGRCLTRLFNPSGGEGRPPSGVVVGTYLTSFGR